MATDTVTIEQFISANGITATSQPVDRNPNMDGSADMDNYKVTLKRTFEPSHAVDVTLNGETIDTVFSWDDLDEIKRGLVNHDGYDSGVTLERRSSKLSRPVRLTLYFSKGIGHHGAEPTADEVLDCLASDAAGIENAPDFEDWCSEYGYDTDSRKAERTFKLCEHQAKRLRNFLGDELYDQLLWHTERA